MLSNESRMKMSTDILISVMLDLVSNTQMKIGKTVIAINKGTSVTKQMVITLSGLRMMDRVIMSF